MKITYFLRGKSDPATVYLRARTDIHDIRIKTPYTVKPDCWYKGKVKKHRIGRTINQRTKSQLTENKLLDRLQNRLNELSESITAHYLSHRPRLTSQWIQKQVNPTNKTPTTFSEYIPTYLELSNLRKTTRKKIGSTLNRILKFRDVPLVAIDKTYRRELLEHLNEMGYSHNTAFYTIKVIQTICNHAHDNGYEVNQDALRLARKLRSKRPPHVYLTQEELYKLERAVLQTDNQRITRDWLLISCNTGQRMGDLFTFTKDDLRIIDGHRFIAMTQSKTGKSIMIPVNNTVERILNHYDGHFPPRLTEASASNEVLYNRLLKKVCQQAEINEPVEANLRDPKTNRYEIRKVPKWKAVSSHIGRRSFATNHFLKMPTSYIKTITGHSTERQLLDYIGKPQQETFVDIAKKMKEIEYVPLTLVTKNN